VVSSEDGQSLFESDLDAEEQADGLERVISSIDVISQKEIVAVGNVSSNFEQLHQIVELAVHVSADVDWGSNIYDIGFF
jgi:CRISPR/Cas system-associated protein Cas5 (RAMP superfamily)